MVKRNGNRKECILDGCNREEMVDSMISVREVYVKRLTRKKDGLDMYTYWKDEFSR